MADEETVPSPLPAPGSAIFGQLSLASATTNQSYDAEGNLTGYSYTVPNQFTATYTPPTGPFAHGPHPDAQQAGLCDFLSNATTADRCGKSQHEHAGGAKMITRKPTSSFIRFSRASIKLDFSRVSGLPRTCQEVLVVPEIGVEPTTYALRMRRSTN